MYVGLYSVRNFAGVLKLFRGGEDGFLDRLLVLFRKVDTAARY